MRPVRPMLFIRTLMHWLESRNVSSTAFIFQEKTFRSSCFEVESGICRLRIEVLFSLSFAIHCHFRDQISFSGPRKIVSDFFAAVYW